MLASKIILLECHMNTAFLQIVKTARGCPLNSTFPCLAPTLVVAHDEYDVGPRPRSVKVLRKEPVTGFSDGGRRRRCSPKASSSCGLQLLDSVMAFPPAT